MRKVEKQMIECIKNRKPMNRQNTMVSIDEEKASIYLHGNHIANYWYGYGKAEPNIDTLKSWPSVTTKSRLRALGVDVYTRKHITYVDGSPV